MLAAAFFAGFAIGGLAVGFVLFPAVLLAGGGGRGRRRMRACVRLSYRFFVWAARVTGLFVVVASPETIRALSAMRGRIVVANHISLIDVVILIALLPDSTAVAKAAAARNPFYSRIVSSVFLVNDDPSRLLSSAAALLGEGVNILVFPEGTRTMQSARRRLRRGAAQIAIHAGAPVSCVRISCDPPVLGKGQHWWDVGGGVVRYGIELRGELAPPALEPGQTSHAAAVDMTAAMEKVIWP